MSKDNISEEPINTPESTFSSQETEKLSLDFKKKRPLISDIDSSDDENDTKVIKNIKKEGLDPTLFASYIFNELGNSIFKSPEVDKVYVKQKEALVSELQKKLKRRPGKSNLEVKRNNEVINAIIALKFNDEAKLEEIYNQLPDTADKIKKTISPSLKDLKIKDLSEEELNLAKEKIGLIIQNFGLSTMKTSNTKSMKNFVESIFEKDDTKVEILTEKIKKADLGFTNDDWKPLAKEIIDIAILEGKKDTSVSIENLTLSKEIVSRKKNLYDTLNFDHKLFKDIDKIKKDRNDAIREEVKKNVKKAVKDDQNLYTFISNELISLRPEAIFDIKNVPASLANIRLDHKINKQFLKDSFIFDRTNDKKYSYRLTKLAPDSGDNTLFTVDNIMRKSGKMAQIVQFPSETSTKEGGTYPAIGKYLNSKKKLDVTTALKDVLKGTKNDAYSNTLGALLFGVETVRNPGALISNIMYLEEISEDKPNFKITHIADDLPMGFVGAVEAARLVHSDLRGYLSHETYYDYGTAKKNNNEIQNNKEILKDRDSVILLNWLQRNEIAQGPKIDNYRDLLKARVKTHILSEKLPNINKKNELEKELEATKQLLNDPKKDIEEQGINELMEQFQNKESLIKNKLEALIKDWYQVGIEADLPVIWQNNSKNNDQKVENKLSAMIIENKEPTYSQKSSQFNLESADISSYTQSLNSKVEQDTEQIRARLLKQIQDATPEELLQIQQYIKEQELRQNKPQKNSAMEIEKQPINAQPHDKNNAFNHQEDQYYWLQDKDFKPIITRKKLEGKFSLVRDCLVFPLIHSDATKSDRQNVATTAKNLHAEESIVGIANHGGHWTAFKISKDSTGALNCKFMDSYVPPKQLQGMLEIEKDGLDRHEQFKQQLQELVKDVEIVVENIECKQQQDGSACGVFALENAQLLGIKDKVEYKDTFSPTELEKTRIDYGTLYAEQCIVGDIISLIDNLKYAEKDTIFIPEHELLTEALEKYLDKIVVEIAIMPEEERENPGDYQYNIKFKDGSIGLPQMQKFIMETLELESDSHIKRDMYSETSGKSNDPKPEKSEMFRIARKYVRNKTLVDIIKQTDQKIRGDDVKVKKVQVKIVKNDENLGVNKDGKAANSKLYNIDNNTLVADDLKKQEEIIIKIKEQELSNKLDYNQNDKLFSSIAKSLFDEPLIIYPNPKVMESPKIQIEEQSNQRNQNEQPEARYNPAILEEREPKSINPDNSKDSSNPASAKLPNKQQAATSSRKILKILPSSTKWNKPYKMPISIKQEDSKDLSDPPSLKRDREKLPEQLTEFFAKYMEIENDPNVQAYLNNEFKSKKEPLINILKSITDYNAEYKNNFSPNDPQYKLLELCDLYYTIPQQTASLLTEDMIKSTDTLDLLHTLKKVKEPSQENKNLTFSDKQAFKKFREQQSNSEQSLDNVIDNNTLGIEKNQSKEAQIGKNVTLIKEFHHTKDHKHNIDKLAEDITSGKIGKDHVILLERKQGGNNFGMKDIILLASVLEHNEKHPNQVLSIPKDIEKSNIYNDALLYKAAKEKGIQVLGMEGKLLNTGQDKTLEYNNAREEAMTKFIKGAIKDGQKKVIAVVGEAHTNSLVNKLKEQGIYSKVEGGNEINQAESRKDNPSSLSTVYKDALLKALKTPIEKHTFSDVQARLQAENKEAAANWLITDFAHNAYDKVKNDIEILERSAKGEKVIASTEQQYQNIRIALGKDNIEVMKVAGLLFKSGVKEVNSNKVSVASTAKSKTILKETSRGI